MLLDDSDGRKLVETISVRYRGLQVRDFGFRGSAVVQAFHLELISNQINLLQLILITYLFFLNLLF